MESIVKEIENLLLKNECKKVEKLLQTAFSKCYSPLVLLEMLLEKGKMLIESQYANEAKNLLVLVKDFALDCEEFVVLIEVKYFLSICYRCSKKYLEALQECKDSVNICKKKPYLYSKLPGIYLNIATILFEDLKNLQKAKNYAEAAYEASKKILSENSSSLVVKRYLAMSMLILGRIEESYGNKELAIMRYSEGIELKTVEKNILDQLKLRLSEICNRKDYRNNSESRRLSSRQKSCQNRSPRKRISSRVLTVCNDSQNSSFTTSSQHHPVSTKVTKEKDYPIEKIIKLQAWAKMVICKKQYEELKRGYDYFVYGIKEIEGFKYLVSVFRKASLHKKKYSRRIINPVIYIEIFPIQKSGKALINSYELKDLCEVLNIKTNESLLRTNISQILSKVCIKFNKISICL